VVGRLRELSNVEKQENQRLQKQLDGQKLEASGLTKDREKLQKDVGRLEAEVIELKEMVRHFVTSKQDICISLLLLKPQVCR